MSIQKFDRNKYRKITSGNREYARIRRVKKARNRFVLCVVACFFAVLCIFSLIRWAVPTEEGPIALDPPVMTPAPSVTPGGQQDAVVPATPTPTPTPVPIVKTETSYTSGSLTITIEKKSYDTGSGTTDYYVADVYCKDMSLLGSAFAGDGTKLARTYEATSAIAKKNGAILAINCDNAGYLSDGIVVRNGVLYRFKPSDREVLLIYKDGTMRTVKESSISSQDEIAKMIGDGLMNTFSFGPSLVNDGVGRGDYSDSLVQTYNPRTAIGMVEKGHYKLVVVDGRTDYNKGVRLIQLEEIMLAEGCTEAYNLDGGQSSTLYFNGKVINDIAGRTEERGVTDIIYFAEPAQ